MKETCEKYFSQLDELTTKSMMCSWDKIRKELDNCDKDIIVSFRNKAATGKEEQRAAQGLAIIGIEEEKAHIYHLSTLREEDFEKACLNVAQYLTNNSRIQEVDFSLSHFDQPEENGEMKLKLSEPLKKKLKDVGFRWKKLTNTENGERYTVFAYKSKEEANKEEGLMRLKTGRLVGGQVSTKHVLMLSDKPFQTTNFTEGKFLV